jgi:hypothetical protein
MPFGFPSEPAFSFAGISQTGWFIGSVQSDTIPQMPHWITSLGLDSINWLVTTLLAIVFAIVANLLTPRAQNFVARFSVTRRQKRLLELKAEFDHITKWTLPEILSLGFRSLLFFVLASSLAAIFQTLGTTFLVPFYVYRLPVSMYLLVRVLAVILYIMAVINAYKAYSHLGKWSNYKYHDELRKLIGELESNGKVIVDNPAGQSQWACHALATY